MAVAACSLADVLDVHGPLPAPIALAIVLFLCDVLDAAHTAGVVHRDVKPPNILVLPSGEVRLADWGIARVHASAHGVTRTGAMLGTLAFMAPEQRRDPRDVRPATDVYALAATLALALTGRAPGELYVPEVLAELRQAVPGGVADAIAAAGRYAPTERVPTPRAFAAQMQQRPSPEAGALFMREWFAKRWFAHPLSCRWQAEVTQVPTRQEKCGSTPWPLAYSGKVSSSRLDLD
jgi:serine/threonine protein kinase